MLDKRLFLITDPSDHKKSIYTKCQWTLIINIFLFSLNLKSFSNVFCQNSWGCSYNHCAMNLSRTSQRNPFCSFRIIKIYVRSGYGTMMSLSLMKRPAIRYVCERCNTCARRCTRSRVRAHRRPTRYATSLQVTWGQPVTELIRRFGRSCGTRLRYQSFLLRSWMDQRASGFFFIKKGEKKRERPDFLFIFLFSTFLVSHYQTKSLRLRTILFFIYMTNN